MKTFSQNGITYLAVEVPEGASEFWINNVGCIRYSESDKRISSVIEPMELGFYATKDNYSIIGLLPSITEEQAKEMVEIVRGDGYVNYLLNGLNYFAKNSLYSRLRSLGFTTENILIIKQLT